MAAKKTPRRDRTARKTAARVSRTAKRARAAAGTAGTRRTGRTAARTTRKAPAARRAAGRAGAARRAAGAAGKPEVKGAAARRAEALKRQLDRARVGTFEQLFEKATPEVRSIGVKLRELIHEVIPDVTETVYLGWRIALYRKETELCGIQPAGDRCNLYFTRGVFLLDPQGLLEGTGQRLRHVKVRSVVGIMAQGIRDLLKQAVEFTGR